MSAVWMRAQNELRTRWRALVSLALIAGIGGGVAIAAVAGARRTDSVYPRFRAATNAYDDLIGVTGDVPLPKQSALIKQAIGLRAITGYSFVDSFTCTVTGPSGFTEAFPDIFPVASPDGRIGTTINRVKILKGRPADPARADEGVLSSIQAQHLGARVGSNLTLRFPDVERRVRVVGIGIAAGEIDPAAGGYIPLLLLTPAFYAQNERPDHSEGPVLAVTVRGGAAGLGEIAKELSGKLQSTVAPVPQNAAVRRTAGFQAVGLAVFAGLAIVTVLAIFGQLLARQIVVESDEYGALRALGMSSRQLMMLSLLRVAVVGLGAALVTVVVAIAASPFLPIGLMRQLETSSGFRVDSVALAIGGGATVLLIILAGVWPAWRASKTAGFVKGERTRATNRTVDALAKASFPPSAVAGVRMALEPGHGATSVPVRTTIFGSVLALTAVSAALAFGASLHTLVATPRLSGWNFDVIDGGNTRDTEASTDGVARRLVAEGTVQSYALGGLPDLSIGRTLINALSFKAGSFGPSIVAGRRPEGPAEIALGSKTIRALHTAIGKTISVQLLDPNNDSPVGKPSPLRIVGSVATPVFFFTQTGSGNVAVVSDKFIISKGLSESVIDNSAFMRFAPGVSLDQGSARIQALAPNSFVVRRSETSDLANLDGISNLPSIGAGLLALVAAGTLVHTLLTSVRRRRRDLAILRALGFVRSQVGLTVVWQASTIMVISLAIGLPVGAMAGRWGWRLFVGQLGYVPLLVVPLLQVLLMIPAALVLANIIAGIPARAAARMQPAVALRAE